MRTEKDFLAIAKPAVRRAPPVPDAPPLPRECVVSAPPHLPHLRMSLDAYGQAGKDRTGGHRPPVRTSLFRLLNLRHLRRLAAIPLQIRRDLVRDFLRELLRVDPKARFRCLMRLRQWAHLPVLW